ncbi:MAG: N-acetylmuramic acid 6-phosphate etherase [Planctomycetota bacterium]|nr:N-acetylmuramic acid 6-phosphate etherase [Planctomycetota bacterium]
MPLPPNRGHVSTEQRHASSAIDQCTTADMLHLILDDQEDAVLAVRKAIDAIDAFIEALVPRVSSGGRLFYLGAGTSGRLGVLDASECPPTINAQPGQVVGIIAGGDEALRRSSEAREDDLDGAHGELKAHGVGSLDTVLGIAAGGTTPWVLGGVLEAARLGAMTGLLTCAQLPPSTKPDHHILLDTGAELLTGSTRLKAGTATKITLNAITTSLFVHLGKVYENLMVDLRATNAKLHDRCLRILCELCPSLERSAADVLLQQADGELKVAIVMARLGVDAREANARLVDVDGHLRAVLS